MQEGTVETEQKNKSGTIIQKSLKPLTYTRDQMQPIVFMSTMQQSYFYLQQTELSDTHTPLVRMIILIIDKDKGVERRDISSYKEADDFKHEV